MNKKIIFVITHRLDRNPSQRFRFEQYFNVLKENGYDVEVQNMIDAEADKIFYAPGHFLGKAKIMLTVASKLWGICRRIAQYDGVFVQREVFMLGTTWFERQMSSKVPMVFDFDDSIWVDNVSEANKRLAFLKDAQKTAKLVEMAKIVTVGNEYLANYARQYNKNVRIIPTTIDTQEYQAIPHDDLGYVTIGWSGSITTIQHFQQAVPALTRIKAKYGDKVRISVIGDGNFKMPELGIVGEPWRKATELSDISAMDIGIMPLPDTEWAKGKCGLKGLQYMAMSVATIMSPVGVNTDIIQHGENGMLASTDDQWFDCLCQLIEQPELRKKLGQNGRNTVLEKYSVEANKAKYLEVFAELVGKAN